MADPKRQWQLLLSRGLANESQLQWAWSQLTPGLDLCDLLMRQSIISPETALQIRGESEATPSGHLYHSLDASASQNQLPLPSGEETVFKRLSAAYLSVKDVEPLFAPHAQHVFRRLGKLGEGGMGVVYRISDQRLGRQAAMKVLKNPSSHKSESSGHSKQLLGRFLREARLTAALDHPCVPAVYELGVNDDREQYMLMRVIEGETLQQRIDEFHGEGGHDLKQRRELLEILLKVSETIAFAHFRQIIHRDLKPSNIMVGQFGEVMLMDWGLARKLDDSQSEDSCLLDSEKELSEDLDATQVGSVIGTFGYMPPEQASGESVDEQADVFALGAILTTLLTGEPPVLGKTAINRMTATIKGQIAVPSDRRAVPPELDCLAASALEAEPAERLKSANEFVVNLKAYLVSEELPLYRYSVFERVKRHIRKHPARYVGLSLLAISALGATLSAIEVSRLKTRRQFDNQMRKLTEEKNKLIEKDNERINREKLVLKRQQKALKKQNQVYELINKAEGIAKRAGPKNEVLQLVEKALALSGHSETAYISAARVFETRLLWREGIEILTEGIKRNPPGYEIYFRIYLIESKRETWIRNRVAVRGGTEVIDLESKAFEEMSKVVDKSGQENEFTLYTAARKAFEEKDYPKSLELLNRAERHNKNMAVLYVQRARVHLAMKNKRAAVKDFQMSLILKPKLYSWFTLGTIYYESKQYKNAYLALERCTQDWSSLRSKAMFMMAKISIHLKNFDKAISLLNEIINEKPRNLEYRERRASLLFYKGYFKDCIRDYSVILAANPNHVESLYWRGACYFSIGKRATGLIDYKKALALDPGNMAARSIPMQFPWLKDALR